MTRLPVQQAEITCADGA